MLCKVYASTSSCDKKVRFENKFTVIQLLVVIVTKKYDLREKEQIWCKVYASTSSCDKKVRCENKFSAKLGTTSTSDKKVRCENKFSANLGTTASGCDKKVRFAKKRTNVGQSIFFYPQ